MKAVLPSGSTVHVGHFDATLVPVAHVSDGELFRLRSVSAYPDDAVPADWLPPEIHEIFAHPELHGPGPHLLTGPVAVDGAVPGDTLQVDIVEVRPGARYGYSLIRPGLGLFPEATNEVTRVIIPLDMAAGTALSGGRVQVPVRPFFGIMGVAPVPDLGRVDSRPPGRHGGNIDCTALTAGSTLFLPVAVHGALFSAGDGHAAQGDGEICLTAIETTMEGVFRLRVRRELSIDGPLAVTPTHLITFGFHSDLDVAAELAGRAMVQHLVEHHGLPFLDAYRLASIAVDLRITQVVNGHKGVHAMIDRGLLHQLGADPFVAAAGS